MPPRLSPRAEEIVRRDLRAQGYTHANVAILLTAVTNATSPQVPPQAGTPLARTDAPSTTRPATSTPSNGALSGIPLRPAQQPRQSSNGSPFDTPPTRSLPSSAAPPAASASSHGFSNTNTRQPAQQPRQPTDAPSPRVTTGYMPPHLRHSPSSTAPPASSAPHDGILSGNTQRPVQQAPRSRYSRVTPASIAPTTNESITIRIRVGPNVAQYHAIGEIWRGFIDGEAWEIMSSGELETSSESVRGIVRRAQAVFDHSERRIYVPPEVVRALAEDLELRELVSTEYQRLSINAHPNSPIEEGNRSHRYFQGCMRQILVLLQRHVGTVTRLGGN